MQTRGKDVQDDGPIERSGHVTPGTQMVHTVSALPGTVGERVLYALAGENGSGRNPRRFSGWREEDGILAATGEIATESGKVVPLTLEIGSRRGLFLEEGPERSEVFSLKYKDGPRIVIGRGLLEIPSETLSRTRVSGLANKIAAWVMHGKFWKDRSYGVHNHPYGNDPRRPVEYNFRVVDGKDHNLTVKQLIELGCIRSTHVGVWKPSTIAAALSGMPVLLHEFAQTNERVANFKGRAVANGPRWMWAPYCSWLPGSLNGRVAGDLQTLAIECRTPFGFHLHATKHLFPHAMTASRFILDRFGEDTLGRMLLATASLEPERFYRLINEDGATFRLRAVKDGKLVYANDRVLDRYEAAMSVLESFKEMAALETDPGFEVQRVPRTVLDSHFYVVAFALAGARGGAAYHLSGSEMYRYLTKEPDAQAHRVRNERLFQAFRDIVDVASLDFHICPPLRVEELSVEDQYSVPPAAADPGRWQEIPLR